MGKMKEFAIEEQNRIKEEEQFTLTDEEYNTMINHVIENTKFFDKEEEEEEVIEDGICSDCKEHCEHSSLTGTNCCGANLASNDCDFDRWED